MENNLIQIDSRHLRSDNIEPVKRLIRRLKKELKIYNEIFYKRYYLLFCDNTKSIEENLHFSTIILAKKHFQDKVNYYNQLLLKRKNKNLKTKEY